MCLYRYNDSGGTCSGRSHYGWVARTGRPMLLCYVADYGHTKFGEMFSVNLRRVIAVLIQARDSLGSGGPLNPVTSEIILRLTALLHEVWRRRN